MRPGVGENSTEPQDLGGEGFIDAALDQPLRLGNPLVLSGLSGQVVLAQEVFVFGGFEVGPTPRASFVGGPPFTNRGTTANNTFEVRQNVKELVLDKLFLCLDVPFK